MANNEGIKSKRELSLERLKGRYPDLNIEDDEAVFGRIYDDYDDYDQKINGYQERENKMLDLFNRDPRSAQFITDMAKGIDPWIAVVNRLGIDGVTAMLNDPEKQEIYAEENKKYLERLAKDKELEEEYERNIAESLDLLDTMKQELNLDDDTTDAVYDFLAKIANDAIVGKFTREAFEMALKAINHDADVETAAAEGEVKGRNEKIEAKMRQAKNGDGLPSVGSNNGRGQARETPELGALDNFGTGASSIWERGGERRIARK